MTKKVNFFSKHKVLRFFIILTLFLVCLVLMWLAFSRIQANRFQSKLQPFYDTTNLNPNGKLGEVVRQEPLGANIQNGTSKRILYRTQKSDGSITFASGMIFLPLSSSNQPRHIVAWAHGTIGMGDSCAPSRLSDPTANIEWVNQMLQNGWVVVATDYAGLGTAGTEGYLIGADEAYDVINSVRAAKQLTGSMTDNQYSVWGHSQGGHSALFTAHYSTTYAPELKLVGTVASAPAAELPILFDEQYKTAVGWVIGPEVLVAWPSVYNQLQPSDIATKPALKNYQKIAEQCIVQSSIGGILRNKLDQSFFSTSIQNVPAWNFVAASQTAPILSSSLPLMIAQSESDQVVLPNTTATYIQKACQNNSNLTSLWISSVGHIQTAQVIAPDVINWISDRFANKPTSPTCNQPLPIAPVS